MRKRSTYGWQMKSTQPSTRRSAVRAKFKYETGDWTRYRGLPNLVEIDFHYGRARDCDPPYGERMTQVRSDTLEALRSAQTAGKDWVLFQHGHSTSRLGAATSRSQVRGVMRSRQETPFIVRAQCIQHYSVF